MNQLVSEVDPSNPQDLILLGDDTKEKRDDLILLGDDTKEKRDDLILLGDDTKEKRDERMMMLKEEGKATTTGHGYGDYPWDPVSLNPIRSASLIDGVTGINIE